MITTFTDLGNEAKRKNNKKNLGHESQLKGTGRRAKHLQIAWMLRYHVQGHKEEHQVLRWLPNKLIWLHSKIKVPTKTKSIQSTKIEENNF